MFFLSSWKYTAEKLKEAEAVLFQLASRYGDRSPESYRMELFDTEIPSSAVPLKGLRDKTLVIHGVQLDALDIDNDNDHDHDHDHKNAKLSKYPLVLLHGYMNGALYYYRNLVGLTKYFSTVYSLDSLGWGRSSRPTFHPLDDSVRATEAVFVESLEAWRHAHDIDKMVLAGHSMGGYLSIAYCEAYPERVERLILISPVGVPVDDKATTRTLSWTTWALTQLYHTFHVTPCTILRSLPEGRGKAYVQGYIEHRLSPAISDPYEQMALTNYLYYNAISNGSGEYAVQRLLTPFAFAKEPTIHRIPSLTVSHISFLYGTQDWMDVNGGLQVQTACHRRRRTTTTATTATTATSKNTTDDDHGAVQVVDVYQVPKAGHLLMLENWKDFETAFCMAAGGGDPEHDGGPMKVQPATSSDDNDDDHVQNAPVPHPLPPDHMVVGE